MKRTILLSLTAVLWSAAASAGWILDNDYSRISFVSTKAGSAAEVHRFATLDGRVDGDGNVTISIDLDSVDTAIEIRDERMREMLFETGRYPTATLAATVDLAAVDALDAGASTTMTTEGQLMLHDTAVSLTIEMAVARLSDSRVLVVSQKPMIVNASQVGLLEGVERLREIAGLPTISPAVPVTFVLAFDRQPE